MKTNLNKQRSQHHAATTCRNNTIIIKLYKTDYSCFHANFSYLSNRILQAVFTHPANDSPSFLACSSICSSKSSSKRIVFIELLGRSYFKFFSFLSCIGYLTSMPRDCNSFRITLFIQPASDSSPSSFCAFSMARRNSGSSLNWNGGLPRLFSDMCIDTSITLMVMCLCVMTYYYHMLKKTIPRSVPPLSRDLTKPLKLGVMIMANRYDNAHPYAKQFRFYNLSTFQIDEVTALTEKEARLKLGTSRLIFVARKPINPMVEIQSRNYCFGGLYHE